MEWRRRRRHNLDSTLKHAIKSVATFCVDTYTKHKLLLLWRRLVLCSFRRCSCLVNENKIFQTIHATKLTATNNQKRFTIKSVCRFSIPLSLSPSLSLLFACVRECYVWRNFCLYFGSLRNVYLKQCSMWCPLSMAQVGYGWKLEQSPTHIRWKAVDAAAVANVPVNRDWIDSNLVSNRSVRFV